MVSNLSFALEHLTFDSTKWPRMRCRKVIPPNRLGGEQIFTKVLSAVTMVHMESSTNITCAAWYQLIHRPIPVNSAGVEEQ